MNILQISLFILCCPVLVVPLQSNIFCYYHMSLKDELDVTDIDLKLCSHLVYDDFHIDMAGNFSVSQPDILNEGANQRGLLRQLGLLKVRYSDLKILASIGQMDSYSTLSNMMKDSRKRKIFIDSTVNFLKQNDFDGLDFGWFDGRNTNDKRNHAILAKELKEELSKAKSLLVLCVDPIKRSAQSLYEITDIGKYSDFIIMRTFELRKGLRNQQIGFDTALSPITSRKADDEKDLNIETLVQFWLDQRIPAEKLIIHISPIGRRYYLDSPENFRPGSSSSRRRPESKVFYNELCVQLQNSSLDWVSAWDAEQKVPYAYYGNVWANYDNPESVKLKTKFALEKKLGGISFGPLQHDDFKGVCGDGRYPLLKEIYSTLRQAKVQYQYYVNVTLVKRNIRSGKKQTIYNRERELDFESDLFSI